MLSTVTLNCQVTKVVMNSGSQLSELQIVSQMSQVCRIVLRRNCERTLPHTIQNATHKSWLPSAKLKPTFTFLVGILPSKSIEYGKSLTRKVKVGFSFALGSQPLQFQTAMQICSIL